MNRTLPALALVAVVLAAAHAAAAPPADPFAPARPKSFDDLATAKLEIAPARAARGETVTVRVTVTPSAQAWTYPVHPKDRAQPSVTKFGFRSDDDLILVGTVNDPPGVKVKPRDDEDPSGPKDEYYPGPKPTVWELKAVVNPNAAPGKQTVGLHRYSTQLQVCIAGNCFPAKDLPTASFEVTDETKPVEAKFKDEVERALNPPVPTREGSPARGSPPAAGVDTPAVAETVHARKVAKPTDVHQEELAEVLKNLDNVGVGGFGSTQAGLGAFLLTAALWGLISLVTPCVFPMIPITVSIFMHRSHGSFAERMKLAGVYCLTIIVVLGSSAFALLKFMGWLSAHPVTNLLLGGLFLVLALSLFGMFDLTLPNFLSRRLQAKQQKGGLVGTVFGALAFTVISFTCVAPFLGGFAGISAAGSGGGDLIAVPTTREVLGGLAFATAFAAPFFVLALVPGLLRALPKSGGWLDSVKVVMGFLELAAALKFLRTAELRIFSPPEYLTYDLVLGAWVAISVACGLYLLNVYRMPHDDERPTIGVPRLLFALLFLGLGVYLLPATFKTGDGKNQRPAGAAFAWVDAFLLPEPGRETDLPWGSDLKAALDRARAAGKPVFVDFTGVTCTNCRINENGVFPQPAVREKFEKFERVQLYTDEVPASAFAADPGNEKRVREAQANRDFKIAAFGTDQLPVYAILIPDAAGPRVRVYGVYPEGKINDVPQFVGFLKGALDAAKK